MYITYESFNILKNNSMEHQIEHSTTQHNIIKQFQTKKNKEHI